MGKLNESFDLEQIEGTLQGILDEANIGVPCKVHVFRYKETNNWMVYLRDLTTNRVPSAAPGQLAYSKNFLASFDLGYFPGCCMYGVSYNTYVCVRTRGKGIANVLQKMKVALAKCIGFSALICTTSRYNVAQNHILPKHGWEKMDTRINKITGNTVCTWIKEL